jgi:hypothetical protein
MGKGRGNVFCFRFFYLFSIGLSFAVSKNKWQILYKMLSYPMWKQNMIIVPTMILHNYICEHTSGDIDFEHVEHDEYYEFTIPERYNKYVVP